MTERAKKLLLLYYKQSRKIRRVSGLPPLTFKAKKAGTLNNYRIYGNTETKTRSYSGSAPLSFPIEDGSVSNYLIYGNTVNGESVGDLVESGEHAGEYKVAVTVTNGTDTETTNIYLPEQIKMVGDEAEYVDYKEQKQHRVRKNLLQNIAASKTISGVTFTVNADGSVTCNGTNTANSATTFNISTYLLIGTYIINGCPKNGSLGTYSVDLRDPSNWYVLGERDTGLGFTFTNNTVRTVYYAIRINPGYTCDNLTFYPMLRLASIADDTYEPYIENTEVDVTLPALPTLPGTNTLTVGTEVQPSSVAVEVNEILSCGDKITDNQSVNYGKYKIPLTLTADSAETTDIYLDTPLAKSGNNADYIDYATQKRHNSDGTESSVTLPEISTLAGTNTLTVGTEVQPSSVEIKGRIKAAGGD